MIGQAQHPDAEGAGARAKNALGAYRMGIYTQYEAVVYMRKDCHVCRSEGLTAHARVRLANGARSIIATLNQVDDNLLRPGWAGLSESAWRYLAVTEGDPIHVSHPNPLTSLSQVRRKVFGHRLDEAAFRTIISDVTAGRYSDIHLSSLITACSAQPLDQAEVIALTSAMVDAGERLDWELRPVADKHCVGGLPGNRTTPIIVAIATCCGLTMPKTSSRAITSPAGTADVMETLAPVDLAIPAMRRVVEREGGCIVWGGSVRLSPADDILIRVERALDLDSEGQLVASVLSKKIAVGSSHVVLDVPVGPTAKVRSDADAAQLSKLLDAVAGHFGMVARIVMSDGSQPVGRGIGPALEARDVIAVLRGDRDAPADLRDRALTLAGALLELTGVAAEREGYAAASDVMESGRAWEKFQAICDAQGGMRTPPRAEHRLPACAQRAGRVGSIDNRRIARVAKLAGAPGTKAAGLELHVRLGDAVSPGMPLYTIHAGSPGELDYALTFAEENPDIVMIEAE